MDSGRSLGASLRRLVGSAVDLATVARVRGKVRRGTLGELDLLTFRGHGNGEWLRLQVRVIEATGLRPGTVDDPWWRNVVAAWHRFVSLEVPGAIVRATLDGDTREAVTDFEGYATFEFPNARPERHGWRTVDVALVAPLGAGQDEVREAGHVLVPDPRAEVGVISDIDDTVLRTGITQKAEMIRSTLLRNAATRLPFAGVSAFYRALTDGVDEVRRPIFYVSGSPWNLYDMIDRFFAVRDIPPGPLFLRDWGLDETKFIHVDGRVHKLGRIGELLDAYPGLRFVLIGDSGEEDPEIYAEVIRRAPGRVVAVYIRDVTDGRRDAAVHDLLETLERHGVPAAFGASTLVAAADAASRGLIDEARLEQVRADSGAPADA